MTLRCDISIVPYGFEEHQRPISRFNIHNIGTLKDLGFGNVICRYQVEHLQQDLDGEFIKVSDTEVEHNRKEGAETLVRKALESLGKD